jgi:hypothetical protein
MLFPLMVEGEDYWENDLEQFLSDISASSNDLKIERVEKVSLGYNHATSNLEARLEIEGPFNVVTYYRPINGVRIVEQIMYRQKTFNHAFREYYN